MLQWSPQFTENSKKEVTSMTKLFNTIKKYLLSAVFIAGIFSPLVLKAFDFEDAAIAVKNHKYKLGVGALSTTLITHQAFKIYKKEVGVGWSYKGFLKAYPGIIKQLFTGKRKFKKDNLGFCRLVKFCGLAFAASVYADYQSPKVVKPVKPVDVVSLVEKKLKGMTITIPNVDFRCPLCLNDFDPNQTYLLPFSCIHACCKDCVKDWLEMPYRKTIKFVDERLVVEAVLEPYNLRSPDKVDAFMRLINELPLKAKNDFDSYVTYVQVNFRDSRTGVPLLSVMEARAILDALLIREEPKEVNVIKFRCSICREVKLRT